MFVVVEQFGKIDPLFLLLPLLLKKGWGFYGSMSVSTLVMVGLYYLMVLLLGKLGIQS